MSEAPKSWHLLAHSRAGDRWVFACCFLLTVFFDMVVAITAGIILAAILFMKEMADATRLIEITHAPEIMTKKLPTNWRVFKITGPLFFAAADKIFSELTLKCPGQTGIILHLESVSLLDAGGVSALRKFTDFCRTQNTQVILTHLTPQVRNALDRAEFKFIAGVFSIQPDLECTEVLIEKS